MVSVKRLLLAIAAPTLTPSVPICSVGITCRPKIAAGAGVPKAPPSSIRCAPDDPAVGIALLGRLEEEDHGAGDVGAHPAEDLGDPERDRHVPVVPAGVLHVGHRRLVGHVDQFGDGQRVHVRPHGDHLAWPPSLQHADDAGDANLLTDLVEAEGAEAIGDQLRRACLAEPELGVAMDVAARLDEAGRQGGRLAGHALPDGRRKADVLSGGGRGQPGTEPGDEEGSDTKSHDADGSAAEPGPSEVPSPCPSILPFTLFALFAFYLSALIQNCSHDFRVVRPRRVA